MKLILIALLLFAGAAAQTAQPKPEESKVIRKEKPALSTKVLPATQKTPAGSKNGPQVAKATGTQYPGRYQLLPAKVLMPNKAGSKTAFDTIFLLDSQTGAVWEIDPYDEISAGNKNEVVIFPSRFKRVFVEGLDGTHEDYLRLYVTTGRRLTDQPSPEDAR